MFLLGWVYLERICIPVCMIDGLQDLLQACLCTHAAVVFFFSSFLFRMGPPDLSLSLFVSVSLESNSMLADQRAGPFNSQHSTAHVIVMKWVAAFIYAHVVRTLL